MNPTLQRQNNKIKTCKHVDHHKNDSGMYIIPQFIARVKYTKLKNEDEKQR